MSSQQRDRRRLDALESFGAAAFLHSRQEGADCNTLKAAGTWAPAEARCIGVGSPCAWLQKPQGPVRDGPARPSAGSVSGWLQRCGRAQRSSCRGLAPSACSVQATGAANRRGNVAISKSPSATRCRVFSRPLPDSRDHENLLKTVSLHACALRAAQLCSL